MAETEQPQQSSGPAPASDRPRNRSASWFSSPRLRPFRALQHPTYATLFGSFAVSYLGFGISVLSLQWIMADLTDNAPRMLGTLWFFMLLPMLVLSPIAGLVADRFDRKSVVITSQLSIAAVAAALTAITFLELLSPVLLFVLAFALGTGITFNGPSNHAITANAVPARDLPSAIAMCGGGLNFACRTVMNAMLQYSVHDDKRGRVMALYIVCWGGLIPIGVLSLGYLGEWLGTPLAVSLFGTTCIALALPAAVYRGGDRQLTRPE